LDPPGLTDGCGIAELGPQDLTNGWVRAWWASTLVNQKSNLEKEGQEIEKLGQGRTKQNRKVNIKQAQGMTANLMPFPLQDLSLPF
jgi:hypothetical protein